MPPPDTQSFRPPIQNPLVDPRTGLATPPFQRFLAALVRRVSAVLPSNVTNDDLAVLAMFQGGIDQSDPGGGIVPPWPVPPAPAGSCCEPAPAIARDFEQDIDDAKLLAIFAGKGAATPNEGAVPVAQADLAAFFLTLGASDDGLLIWVTDYGHLMVWTGAAPAFADGGSNYFVMAQAAPTAVGYHLCDGSTVSFLQEDGSLGSIVLPDTDGSNAYAKLGAAYDPTITPAAAPLLSGNTSGPTGSGATQAVATGAGTNVASISHLHGFGTLITTLPNDPVAHFPVPLYFRQ